jgi:hypothetical protein
MNLPTQTIDRRSLLRPLAGLASSTITFIAWKVFDSSVMRQIERQVPPEWTGRLAVIVEWVIPFLILAPAVGILWSALRRAR